MLVRAGTARTCKPAMVAIGGGLQNMVLEFYLVNLFS